MHDHNQDRLDSEWTTLNALRELIRLASQGDSSKATYDHALALGAVLCPEILGDDVSLIKRARESDVVREFRQKAQAKTRITGKEITAAELIAEEIAEYRTLLTTARNQQRTDRLKKRLASDERALAEIDPTRHTENQLIFRDAYNADRNLPERYSGHAYKDFGLSDDSILRVRVFHPERPEHITGADVIYERHHKGHQRASLVAIQYKIWDNRSLPLSDPRLQQQLARLKAFLCDRKICSAGPTDHNFRFPFCSAFLRPTDRLQRPDQKLVSSGEHLPICQIEKVKSVTRKGVHRLDYRNIRGMSLSQGIFEGLFTTGKLGSKTLSYAELEALYQEFGVIGEKDRVVIHAQDFPAFDDEFVEDL